MSPGRNAELTLKPKLDIESLVKVKLPPMRSTVLRLMELLRDSNVLTSALAETVNYDPILTARVLRLANSAMYSLRAPVITINKALDAIGTKALYDLVVLDTMAEGFGKEIRNSVLIRTIWEHSVAVGLLSRQLVKIIGLQGGEEAFICGLLHDIGRILMLRVDVERFESLLGQNDEYETLEWEERIYGFDHTEVGAYVASKWRLPETVCSVILHHHDPSHTQLSLVMANVVNVADLVTNINGYGLRLASEEEIYESEAVAFLRLNRHQLFKAWDDIQVNIDEVLSVFE